MDIAYRHITDHRSSREGARIHGAVLHTTEGSDNPHDLADLKQLGSIFDGEEASANYGVNVAGKFGEYVPPSEKAWAQCNFNPVMLSLEQIAFAHYTHEEWMRHRHAQLHGAAEFLVFAHIHYGVPLRPGKVSGSSITESGIFQHKDLGISGSGHVDCGPGYPQGYVTELAQYFVAHKLHPKSVHAERLRRKINNVRHHYGIQIISSPKH